MAFGSILVSTGFPYSSATKTTEIVNIDNDGLTCKDLEDYPLQITGAVGFSMGSIPVICGGYDRSTSAISNQCYRLESRKWKPFANLVQGYVGCIRFALILLIDNLIYIFDLGCNLNSCLCYQILVIFTSYVWIISYSKCSNWCGI